MKISVRRLFLLCSLFALFVNIHAAEQLSKKDQAVARKAAMQVISNFMGDAKDQPKVVLDLSLPKDDAGCDRFGYELKGRRLVIKASSGVAACRAFYDFVKSNEAGICSWSANRFSMPRTLKKTRQPVCTSPYRDHEYLNVVTYGYSVPYWDRARWDKELDWMALHGIDMPLMLVGSEGIYFDVFTKDFGIPAEDVHNWEVGPAHLPWMRMGNLAGKMFDGPLDAYWYDQQKALAHHLLQRMKALGMKPVCPAFGGFVPPSFAKYNAGATLTNTGWDWVLERGEYNTRLNPDSEHFVNVGKAFIKRWEEEYGKSYEGMKYYLSDSFNEMEVPDADMLKVYGENIFRSISEGSSNPEAVWVTQGWDFVYGASKWTNGKTPAEKFKALTDAVPDHQVMVLYMSPEYGGYGNKIWETFDNFNNKDWNYTMLPNMGGKNFWTGCLDDYANTFPANLNGSAGKANCTGFGLTMEGIEYNELLYELITDIGWSNPAEHRDVKAWVEHYGRCRYGDYTPLLQHLHATLLDNVYHGYVDHQRFGWQGFGGCERYYDKGNIDYLGDSFFTGMEQLFCRENISLLKKEPLSPALRYDLIEAAAFYASARVEHIAAEIVRLADEGEKPAAAEMLAGLEKVMRHTDRSLTAHPLYNLQVWESKALAAAGNDADRQKQYVRDARSIVSTWHSNHGSEPTANEPVNDYSCRLWAGLIRGYYLPRLKAQLSDIINGTETNLRTIENRFVSTQHGTALPPVLELNAAGAWVEADAFSAETPDALLLDYLQQLVAETKELIKR